MAIIAAESLSVLTGPHRSHVFNYHTEERMVGSTFSAMISQLQSPSYAADLLPVSRSVARVLAIFWDVSLARQFNGTRDLYKQRSVHPHQRFVVGPGLRDAAEPDVTLRRQTQEGVRGKMTGAHAPVHENLEKVFALGSRSD